MLARLNLIVLLASASAFTPAVPSAFVSHRAPISSSALEAKVAPTWHTNADSGGSRRISSSALEAKSAPTWQTDADSEGSGTAWDNWLYDDLPGLDLKGKKVAMFGVGGQNGYSDNYCGQCIADTYCDAAGELYDRFKDAGWLP